MRPQLCQNGARMRHQRSRGGLAMPYPAGQCDTARRSTRRSRAAQDGKARRGTQGGACGRAHLRGLLVRVCVGDGHPDLALVAVHGLQAVPHVDAPLRNQAVYALLWAHVHAHARSSAACLHRCARVCVCVCTCLCVHMCECTCACVSACMHVPACVRARVCACVCMCVFACVSMRACARARVVHTIFTMSANIHACIRLSACLWVYAYICALPCVRA